jgi:hypothetical protein
MLVSVEQIDPLNYYLTRLEFWRRESSRDERQFKRIGNWRLATVIVAAALGWFAFARNVFSGWLLLAPLGFFVTLIIYHERVARRQQLAARAIAYNERGLARLDDRWMGTGNPGSRFQNDAHIYASDIDVFGRGSLFELICVARTSLGEDLLARWLLEGAARDEVQERQAAVADLRGRIQLREDVALLGDDVRAGVHAEGLAAWAGAPAVRFVAGARPLALALACWNIITFAAYMAHAITEWPLLVGIGCALVLGAIVRKPVQQVTAGADAPAQDLQVLAMLLERLEREEFKAPRLKELRQALDIEGLPASRRIARLGRWMEYLDSCDHLVVRIIGPALLWRQQVAMSIEQWRRRNRPHTGRWLDAVAELEALSSLAALSFERPEWGFPELLDGPRFDAAGLRHPLMSPRLCVPNDLKLGGDTTLLIVSGSNMSGKSTLLRAAGLNTILAWAGAPVAAHRLSIGPLAVGASLRTVDSLQEGRSRFYAEITRLRQIVELASGPTPALFLLDELLSGTNSHDRRIGAEAIVRTLVERGAIGLVTTHDLALTQITTALDGRAVNVHFEDHLENGRISFDYTMRPGVVQRSNALELMRAVGLNV